jgi:hypothetical protein
MYSSKWFLRPDSNEFGMLIPIMLGLLESVTLKSTVKYNMSGYHKVSRSYNVVQMRLIFKPCSKAAKPGDIITVCSILAR